MPLDPDARRLLALLGAVSASLTVPPTPEERRRSFRNFALSWVGTPPVIQRVESFIIPGPGGALCVRAYIPFGVRPRTSPAVIYLHGGWVTGDLDSYDGLCRELAASSGCRVFAVDYRLAPEHRFPCALEDAATAISWLIANALHLEIDSDRLAVAGDSVGANLVAGVCRWARQQDVALKLQVMFCPVLDAVGTTESRHSFAAGYFLDQATIGDDFRLYCPPGLGLTDPRISPLRSTDLAGLPPAHIHTAEFDPVRDEGRLYADKLAGSGVPVSYQCHAGMIHHFYGMSGVIPTAESILKDAAMAVGRVLHSGLAFDAGATLQPPGHEVPIEPSGPLP